MNIVTREQVDADPKILLFPDLVILDLVEFLGAEEKWLEREGDA